MPRDHRGNLSATPASACGRDRECAGWTRRESNPHLNLGRVACCRYTTSPSVVTYTINVLCSTVIDVMDGELGYDVES